ncbi:MAG: hypothetical protein U0L93_05875 [Bacteroidales bacterium]|nr:hypothetical protein [Bacteroidales bacterium]
MKKVLKKICFIAVLFSLFACEETPSEYEYSVTNKLSTYDNIQKQDLITDMIYTIELDNNNIILNKRKIKDLNTNESASFVVSSSIKSVYAVYRFRRMNTNGSPVSIEYIKTRLYSLSKDNNPIIYIEGSFDNNYLSEEEFYNLINN